MIGVLILIFGFVSGYALAGYRRCDKAQERLGLLSEDIGKIPGEVFDARIAEIKAFTGFWL